MSKWRRAISSINPSLFAVFGGKLDKRSKSLVVPEVALMTIQHRLGLSEIIWALRDIASKEPTLVPPNFETIIKDTNE